MNVVGHNHITTDGNVGFFVTSVGELNKCRMKLCGCQTSSSPMRAERDKIEWRRRKNLRQTKRARCKFSAFHRTKQVRLINQTQAKTVATALRGVPGAGRAGE